ncbi:MAG: helicase-related protein [Bilifractor sp.]|jgi:SNF2 family DNA or RNA helicase
MIKMKTFTYLLPYQEQAVEKLRHIKIGALYMEMGTGKTRTALELIRIRLAAKKVDHVLWLCPCNIKADIRRGIRKHSDLDDLGILDIVGIETLSTSIRECSRLLELVQTNNVYLVVDESSLVKNHTALRTVHIQQLADRCRYKLILNGTPITRNEADLFAQWRILDWRILGYKSYYSFAANHLEFDDKGRIRRVLNTDYLAEKIAPYTFEKKKVDCFSLPSKRYRTEYFDLTMKQDQIYDYVVDQLLTSLDEMSNTAIYQLFGALQSVVSGYSISVIQKGRFPHAIRGPYPDPENNPRMQTLFSCLEGNEDKVIIFCSYTDEINSIVKRLINNGKTAVAFDGELSRKKRDAAVDAFRKDTQYFVANKSCGAFGLNLQFCHKIIFYSHDWDWGTRAQAEDRVHRLGQTHEVDITDICADNTIDIQIMNCLRKKENLSDMFKRDVARLQSKDIRAFLRGKELNGKDLSEKKCV